MPPEHTGPTFTSVSGWEVWGRCRGTGVRDRDSYRIPLGIPDSRKTRRGGPTEGGPPQRTFGGRLVQWTANFENEGDPLPAEEPDPLSG